MEFFRRFSKEKIFGRKEAKDDWQAKITRFKEELETPQNSERIRVIFEKYQIRSYCQRIYFDFEDNRPVMDISPAPEKFKEIINKHKPSPVRYSATVPTEQNWDSKGIAGSMVFDADEGIVITSQQYVFGPEGVFENYREMGYEKREEQKGYCQERFFVLKNDSSTPAIHGEQ